jgi:malonyl-CoA O-methyltransferase
MNRLISKTFTDESGMKIEQTASPLSDVEILPVRDGYDRWAEIYDEEDNPLIVLEEPRVTELLGEVRGLRIADIGCGTGRHALRLAAAGAIVTGVDFSEVMLKRARDKPGAHLIRFEQHDLGEALPFETASFDRVLCCLVAEHMEDLSGFFRELNRVCRSSGFLVMTAMHPAMMLRGVQARFRDPRTGREVRPRSRAHQVSDYVMAVARSGLILEAMSEHSVDHTLACRSPRGRKYLGWPLLLAMRLAKSPSTIPPHEPDTPATILAGTSGSRAADSRTVI